MVDIKCKQCHWFDYPTTHGRHEVLCADIGAGPDDPVCGRYVPRGDDGAIAQATVAADTERLFDTVALQSYRDHFINIIADRYAVEKQLGEAVEEINRRLRHSGADVKIDAKLMMPTVDQLLNIFALYRLCGVVGLQSFRDDIVRQEIQRWGGRGKPIK